MKQQVINSFGGGINKDLNQLSTPADVLTDCLNGTIITHNGNEFSLQNDMGNAKIGTAFLKDGYIPVGMKEYGGIIYVAAYNPETNKGQVGCFPSPQQLYTNTNKITEYSINLDQFYISSDEISGRYGKNAVVIGSSNIREIVQVGSEEVVLYPGDKFIFNASLDDKTLQAIKDGVLTINLALLTPSGSLEYINQNTLNTYQYEIGEGTANMIDHWILDKKRLFVNADLDTILSSKNEDFKKYIQVLKSNSSGKLVVVANLNTIENTNYTVEYTKNSDNNYGIKVRPSITTRLKDYGVISTTKVIKNGWQDIKMDYFPHERGRIEISKNSDFSEGTEIKISAAPYTNYGIVDKFYQEFSLSYDDTKDGEDDLKIFRYWVFDDRIEIELSYTYIDFYNTKVKNTINIYDASQEKGEKSENAVFTQEIEELNGTQIIIINFDDKFKKGKLYVCELHRKYENANKDKSIYNYLYMTPLFNGVNIIGLEQLKVDGISKAYRNYTNINNISLSSNTDFGPKHPGTDKSADNLFTCNYQHLVNVPNEGTFNVSQVTINDIEYDWNTYFIGDGELTFNLANIEYDENLKTHQSVKSDNATEDWINTIKGKLDDFKPKFTIKDEEFTIKDEEGEDVKLTHKKLTLDYPFIVDYQVGKVENQIVHGWEPFLTQNNVSGIKSPFTFDYFQEGQEERYGPGKNGQLVAAIVQQHEGLANHIISTNPDNIPKYKTGSTWKDVPRDKANEYYPNSSVVFDEEGTQKSFTTLMNLAKNGEEHKTIGIITGGWGDYASLGFYPVQISTALVRMNNFRAYRTNSEEHAGYAWYDGTWKLFSEVDADDNWMFACMQELDQYEEPGNWRFLNLASKRYEDAGYLRADELLKQLFSQLYVYKSSVVQMEESNNYYTKPLPECISTNESDNDNIKITINFNIAKSPFDISSNVNAYWKDPEKEINDYLPKFSITAFEDIINLKYSEIYNKVHNYVEINKDSYIKQEEKETLLDKNQIYIADIGEGDNYNNGIFTLTKFDTNITTQNQIWKLNKKQIQFKLNGEYKPGMSGFDINEYFVYKDENIYLRNIPENSDIYSNMKLILTKGVESDWSEGIKMRTKSICDAIRFIYQEKVNL